MLLGKHVLLGLAASCSFRMTLTHGVTISLHGSRGVGSSPEVQVLHGAGGDEGFLGVVQHIPLGVHADLVISHIHPCKAQALSAIIHAL